MVSSLVRCLAVPILSSTLALFCRPCLFLRFVLPCLSVKSSIDVKKRFFTFFILVTFLTFFQRFLLLKKRWQSSERQAD